MSLEAPQQLRVSADRRTLTVKYAHGSEYTLPAELLRVQSPSAEVQGHSPEQRKLVHGKRKVEITRIDPVGNYAVRITFGDGHNTGIYTWTYLSELGENLPERLAEYEAELAAKGLSRDA